MDENKRILSGFGLPAFAGIPAAPSNVALMSTLQQLSGLSAPMMPTDIAQWAAATQHTNIFDQAKVAAMIPMYSALAGGVKGVESDVLMHPSTSRASAALPVNSPHLNHDSPLATASGPGSSHQSHHSATPGEMEASCSQPSSQQQQPFDLSAKDNAVPSTSKVFDSSTAPSTAAAAAGQPSDSLEPEWANLDISDFDLFMGASAKEKEAVMHSVLDYDMGSIFQSDPTPSTVNGGASTSRQGQGGGGGGQSNAQQREELANADMELDRLLSLVAERNDDEKKDDLFPFGLLGASGGDDGALSPVQFTPPDSPTPVADPMFSLFSLPSTSSEPKKRTPVAAQQQQRKQLPLPRRERETRDVPKVNKVPIYKLKTHSTIVNQPKVEEKVDDAYSFTDEEEDPMVVDKKEVDMDVQQKLARLAGQPHVEGRNGGNVYVPGVGFAVPQEPTDLWRHVVPKKRHALAERPLLPSTPLLPPAAQAEASQAIASLTSPEIVSLAESIRRRKIDRLTNRFVKTETSGGSECAKGTGETLGSVPPPRLPKLLIRIPKRPAEETYEREKKKHKKKKNKDRDHEWEGSDRARKKRRKKHRDRTERDRERDGSVGYMSRLVTEEEEAERKWLRSDAVASPVEERPAEMIFNKKKRLMAQWQDAEQENKQEEPRANGSHNVEEECVRERHKPPPPASADFHSDAVRKRLAKFGSAEGYLPKGTFVVAKSDLFKEDCALWRVDNQNLLQKYIPRLDADTKRILYKNSSTYSGWCEQIASGYLTIKVDHIKQSRSECVVEPCIPIADLFPAVSHEMDKAHGSNTIEAVASTSKEVKVETDSMALLRDPIRLALNSFTDATLQHALSFEFYQKMKMNNDWTFLSALTEMERSTSDGLEKLRARLNWTDVFLESLSNYVSVNVADSDLHSVTCQACCQRPVDRTLQLYGYEKYDPDTLVPIEAEEKKEKEQDEENVEEEEMEGRATPLPAMEQLVCSPCSLASQLYHKCLHLKMYIMKRCEDKLEWLNCWQPSLSPEGVVDACRKNRAWIAGVVGEFADVLKQLHSTLNFQ